jgi:FkbM family methyltransferase
MMPLKRSYSQHGEDILIESLLPRKLPPESIYIEVGANQPTHLSNTYTFYRKGFRGVLVEPDRETVSLLRRFRPRDTVINILCGADARLKQFNASVISVFNSVHDVGKDQLLRSEYLPQLPLDSITRALGIGSVFLLSTDTEGYDKQVLFGAATTLDMTLFVCVEYHGSDERADLVDFLRQRGFEVAAETKLNLILRNTKLGRELNL